MTTTVIDVGTVSDITDGFDLAANGDTVVVAPNTFLGSEVANGVSATGGGYVIDDGDIFGALTGVDLNTGRTSSDYSEVWIAAQGVVEGSSSAWGIDIPAGSFTIQNYGQVLCAGNDGYAVGTGGGGTLVNDGTMSGTAVGVQDFDVVSTDHYYLQNYGTIVGTTGVPSPSGDAFLGTGTDIESILNSGTMQGAVVLGNGAGDLFNSTLGKVDGTITAGSGGDTIIAGQSGGSVVGGSGNDILYANPTQTAANDAAQTTLDGGAGKNALYGDGAYTTFLSGDTDGGYNQIWGELSQMAGVSGYANNTLSYADAATGIYVDLATNDAYVNSTGAQAWKGTGTFEDSIEHVPNVVGSAYGDLIQADNGVDRITGGGGADKLYAGTGASSQDTFVYNGYTDSNLINGYDTIAGFKIGVDKIDVSAMDVSAANLVISTKGLSNTVYVEQTPGVYNAGTNLALSINTAATGGLHASDFVF